MTWEILQKFIHEEDKRLRDMYHNYPDEEKRTYARMVKFMEEAGEFSNEVLASFAKQRNEKLNQHNKETLAHEFADVLITALLVAQILNIDVSQALDQKIKKIEQRHKQET